MVCFVDIGWELQNGHRDKTSEKWQKSKEKLDELLMTDYSMSKMTHLDFRQLKLNLKDQFRAVTWYTELLGQLTATY